MKTTPIGYLIRLLDRLIEADLNRALVPFGIDRRRWQVLNLLTVGPLTAADIAVQLAPFLPTPEDAGVVVDMMVRAGWANRSAQTFTLTSAGNDLLLQAGHQVSVARSRVSDGISRENYQTTVDTLETMCRNLGWRES